MFTGIIEAMGRIDRIEPQGGDLRLGVRIATCDDGAGGVAPVPDLPWPDPLRLGESIAVSGVCLTVVDFDAEGFRADVSTETLARTTLGRMQVGDPVNLERALLPTTRLGGHLVAGHVDGIGAVRSIAGDGRAQRWRFTAPAGLMRFVAEKGSIAVDGVSLTVNQVDAEGFDVALVPHTLAHTAFAALQVGAAVNLEVDLIARYVARLGA